MTLEQRKMLINELNRITHTALVAESSLRCHNDSNALTQMKTILQFANDLATILDFIKQ